MGGTSLEREVTISLLLDEVSQMVNKRHIEMMIAYMTGKYKISHTVARNAAYTLQRIGVAKAQVLCKVAELIAGKGISLSRVYRAASSVFGVSSISLEALTRFVPVEFRSEVRSHPSQGEIITVVKTLSDEQLDMVRRILQNLQLTPEEQGALNLPPEMAPPTQESPSLAQEAATDHPLVETESADESEADATEVAAEPQGAAEPVSTPTSASPPMVSESEASALESPVTEAERPESAELTLAESLRALARAEIPGFSYAKFVGQLEALVRHSLMQLGDATEITQLQIARRKLDQDREELEQLLRLTKEEAEQRAVQLVAEARAHGEAERQKFRQSVQRWEGCYEELRELVTHFLSLTSMQQAATLADFRLKLTHMLARCDQVWEAVAASSAGPSEE